MRTRRTTQWIVWRGVGQDPLDDPPLRPSFYSDATLAFYSDATLGHQIQ
jgi:hypothetical protein